MRRCFPHKLIFCAVILCLLLTCQSHVKAADLNPISHAKSAYHLDSQCVDSPHSCSFEGTVNDPTTETCDKFLNDCSSAVPIEGVAGSRTERTFLAVKPDGVQRGLVGEIIKRFETKGFKLVGLKMIQASTEQVEGHYEEHRGRPFFPALVSFFASGPVVAMVWEGEDVILTARNMMGKTKPKDSAPGTIRGDFAVNMGRNIIHGSDSADSAKREISHWFKDNEVVNWNPATISWLYE